ncbi:MAG: type II toxin-antitoxin system PemK/MazF family toxin [Chloroflexota bacterium]|nr:type II toxin-antitoxin system PemK/MazF family toxin [Chloroflexota bacterium]
MSPLLPSRTDVWLVDLDPPQGHEQGGVRPILVVSTDDFNHGRFGMTIVLPITSVNKRIPFHVAVDPIEGGLSQPSFIKCEDIRVVSTARLKRRFGRVTPNTMRQVSDLLRKLLDD